MNEPLARRVSLLLAVGVAFLIAAFGSLGCAKEKVVHDVESAPPAGGPATYLGTAACADCHADTAATFATTGHPFALNLASDAQVAGHFPHTQLPGPPPGNEWTNVSYVVGGFGWKADFVDASGNLITGDQAQWNIGPGAWGAFGGGQQQPFDCAACHTTGYVSLGNQNELPGVVGTWNVEGVQCEACHGPGSQHASDPFKVPMKIDRSAAACGQCHGIDDGKGVPAADGFIQDQHQNNELMAGKHGLFDCVDCHEPHVSAANDPADAIKTSCASCHYNEAADQTSFNGGHAFGCVECHMPRVVKSAVGDPTTRVADVRSHLFAINASADATMFSADGTQANGYLTLDYVCLRCHADQTKEWAASMAPFVHSGGNGIPRIPPGHVLTANCYLCHPNIHEGRYAAPDQCLFCHVPVDQGSGK